MGVFKDIFTGNFSAIPADFEADVAKLPNWAQSLITTLETDEGQILSGLVETAAQDVLAGGLTTASFTNAAKNVASQLVSQNITLGTQTIYSALNAAVAEVAPAATPVAPATETATPAA